VSELPSFKPGDLFCLANDDGRDYPIGCIGTNGGSYDFGAYALGYFEAASRLLRDIHENPYMLDPLVYPLCFLYRQGIELSIKHLLNNLPVLFREKCIPNKDHKLTENWICVRTYMVCLHGEYPDEPRISESTLNWVEVVLKDFVSTDPNSLVFRYPESKDGKPYLQDKSHVNFTQFGKFMEPLSKWFQETIIAIDQMVYESSSPTAV